MNNNELKAKIEMYCDISEQIKSLEEVKKAISGEILHEMDRRETILFEEQKIITERLQESVTASGKALIKATAASDEINEYINVTLSRFINTRAARKIV